MGAKTMNMILAIAVAVFMLHGTDAAEYTVGDDLGWTIPPGGAATYVLVYNPNHQNESFNFAVGEQDLAFVTKEDFDACNTAEPLAVFQEPGKLRFGYEGTYYMTCTFAGHCAKGQKIALYFAPSGGSPSPSPAASQSQSQSADDAAAVKFVSKKEYGFKKLMPVTMKSL
ncbi:mavicyanin [Prunus yedoensis var. nudiflora]|uniref:Mavicyanin n=1 Tax=Prunus yedoensis var. nudiflora TaxID=2094558 RepID=A0A314XWR9_PRUYE|nr:mavicyanin [Prunus yedoensis var. nudiflora]